MKKISVVSPCYNEEKNIAYFYHQVKAELDKLFYVFIQRLSDITLTNHY